MSGRRVEARPMGWASCFSRGGCPATTSGVTSPRAASLRVSIERAVARSLMALPAAAQRQLFQLREDFAARERQWDEELLARTKAEAERRADDAERMTRLGEFVPRNSIVLHLYREGTHRLAEEAKCFFGEKVRSSFF